MFDRIGRLRTGCFIHCVSEATGKSFDSVNETLQNQCHTTLAMRGGCNFRKFRKMLEMDILARLEFNNGCPPPSDSPEMVHRDKILKLLIPENKKGLQRISNIQQLCQSPISGYKIVVYLSGGEPPNAEKFAETLAKLLAPKKMEMFQRQRWVKSLQPISALALLFEFYHLGETAFPRWVIMLKGKPVPPLSTDLREEQDIHFENLERDFQWKPTALEKRDMDWSKYHRCQQAGAVKLGLQRTTGANLMLARVGLNPMVTILNQLLWVDSPGWAKKQMKIAIESGSFKGRGEVLRSRAITLEYFAEVGQLLDGHIHWDMLQDRHKTLDISHKAFAMLSRGAATIMQLVHKVLGTFPWVLFDLLHCSDARMQQMLNSCRKLWDCCAQFYTAQDKHFDANMSQPQPFGDKSEGKIIQIKIKRYIKQHNV